MDGCLAYVRRYPGGGRETLNAIAVGRDFRDLHGEILNALMRSERNADQPTLFLRGSAEDGCA